MLAASRLTRRQCRKYFTRYQLPLLGNGLTDSSWGVHQLPCLRGIVLALRSKGLHQWPKITQIVRGKRGRKKGIRQFLMVLQEKVLMVVRDICKASQHTTLDSQHG